MSNSRKYSIHKLTTVEKEAITQMYRMYDHKLKETISNYLARNLMKQLGFDVQNIDAVFEKEVSLEDLLMVIDQVE